MRARGGEGLRGGGRGSLPPSLGAWFPSEVFACERRSGTCPSRSAHEMLGTRWASTGRGFLFHTPTASTHLDHSFLSFRGQFEEWEAFLGNRDLYTLDVSDDKHECLQTLPTGRKNHPRLRTASLWSQRMLESDMVLRAGALGRP